MPLSKGFGKPSADGVLASVTDLAQGRSYEVEASYVLACDGGRTVGKLVGIELEGLAEVSRRQRLSDCQLRLMTAARYCRFT